MRVLLLAALVTFVAAGCGGETAEPSTAAPAPPARQAPKVEGITIDGERLSLASFRGRPVLVNVWSSW